MARRAGASAAASQDAGKRSSAALHASPVPVPNRWAQACSGLPRRVPSARPGNMQTEPILADLANCAVLRSSGPTAGCEACQNKGRKAELRAAARLVPGRALAPPRLGRRRSPP